MGVLEGHLLPSPWTPEVRTENRSEKYKEMAVLRPEATSVACKTGDGKARFRHPLQAVGLITLNEPHVSSVSRAVGLTSARIRAKSDS
jgi:hypothetical protein